MSLSLVIFDMDGTLVDSQAFIIDVMLHTFDAARLDRPKPADIRKTIGLSLEHAMQDLVPGVSQAEGQRLADLYRQTFRRLHAQNDNDSEHLFDGVHEILTDLNAAGHLCAVATGKSRRGVNRVFETYDLSQFFQSVQTADTHPSKPHPSMIQTALQETGADTARCVMVGDTSYDMLMARNAGVLAVGVPWGYHSTDELRRAGAHEIVETWSDLKSFCDDL